MITRNQKENRHKFCSEPLELVENYQQALAEGFKGWCIHHRLEIQPDWTRVSRQELKDNGLYYDRPASELIFMRFGEHTSLHNKGKAISEDSRRKIAESLKGKHHSEEHSQKIAEANKGKHRSAETRLKMSAALKGRTFSEESRRKMSEAKRGKNLSEEHRRKMSKSWKGMLWWNNGISSKRSKECPGEGWTRGRLKFK